jgi:hypothetical protein
VTSTIIPSMIIEAVELRSRPGIVTFKADPIACDHVWEPHLWEVGHAYCPQCGSIARWVNDPRLAVAS